MRYRQVCRPGLVLATLLLSWTPGHAQVVADLSVRVGADQLVSATFPDRPFAEPHLTANPHNPLHLVGAAIMSVRDTAELLQTHCVALASFDGGRTWVTHEFTFQHCNDPWVAILDDGTAVFVGLEIDRDRVPHMWLFRSPDGGRTWTTPGHSFGRNHDHPTLTVDRTGGRFHGALYVVSVHPTRDNLSRRRSNAFVARSMDGGKTFPYITEHRVTNLVSNTLTAAVLPDGALLVPVSDFMRYGPDDQGIRLRNGLWWVIRSDDGGAHFGPPMLVIDGCVPGGGRGFASMAVDLSAGPRRGRVYAVCSGPYVMRSDDGGDRWSEPVYVPKTPPAEGVGRRHVHSIAVNRDGIVAVSWHGRGADTTSTCWEVFVAFSGDGGETFTEAHMVSTKPSCPSAGNNGFAARRWPFGGDYSGLTAAADGTFHLLWADSRGERYELRAAQVRVTK